MHIAIRFKRHLIGSHNLHGYTFYYILHRANAYCNNKSVQFWLATINRVFFSLCKFELGNSVSVFVQQIILSFFLHHEFRSMCFVLNNLILNESNDPRQFIIVVVVLKTFKQHLQQCHSFDMPCILVVSTSLVFMSIVNNCGSY